MVRGEMKSRGGNYFLPEGHKIPGLYSEGSMKEVGAFILLPKSSDTSFHHYFPTAHLCENCNKIIIDCEH